MNRRLRGLLGIALVWGAGWTVVGLAAGGLQALALRAGGAPVPMALSRFVVLVSLRSTVLRVVAGALFAIAVWYVGRRAGSVGALSARRLAARGALAGAVLPLGLVALLAAAGLPAPLAAVLVFVATGAAFGAGTAAGTIALARRAPEPLVTRRDSPALSRPVA